MSDLRGGVFSSEVPESRAPPIPLDEPTTTKEIVDAHWTLGRQDLIGAQDRAVREAYAPIVGEMTERSPKNWLGMPSKVYIREGWMSGRHFETDGLWKDIAQQRKRDPSFMKDIPATNDAEFRAWVKSRETTKRRGAQEVVSRQRGVGQGAVGFAADVATGLTDPINLGAMIVTGGGGAARTIFQTAAREALINGATEAVELPIIAANRAEYGEEMTAGDIATDLAAATVGGAIFGAGARAAETLGKKVAASAPVRSVKQRAAAFSLDRASLEKAGDEEVARRFAEAVPPEYRTPDQKAALRVIEGQAETDRSNPFVPNREGMDAHAANLDGGMGRVTARPTARMAAPSLSQNRIIRFTLNDLEGGDRVVHFSTADGGTTKFGIAAKFNPGVDIANLTEEGAATIARRRYWFPELNYANPRTAAVAFDAGYIGGVKVGRRILAESGGDPGRALRLYRMHLNHIADVVPGKAKFRKGWNNRVDKLGRLIGDEDVGLRLDPAKFDDDTYRAGQAALDADQLAVAADSSIELEPVPKRELAPFLTGGAERVVTSRGREADTVFEVREARDLIDSGSADYNPSLQPRDRAGRAASEVQIAEIVAKFDPLRLANSRLASQGAPIIGPDMMVESGNGRIAAIRRVYAEHPERAAAYREMIETRFPEAQGMEQPILVRRRAGDMTHDERRAWVHEANERDTMAMSAPEQAAADARTMSAETVASYRGGDLTDARNRPFVRAFLDETVAPSEINSMVDRNGVPSAEGLRRMNRAMLARAYEAPDLVAQIAEAADTNIKAIGNVLTQIAPRIAQLRDLIREGKVDAQFDLSEPLADLTRRVRDARDSKTPIGDILKQDDMFGGAERSATVEPETAALLRLFFRGQDLKQPRSVDKIVDALENYIDVARQGPDAFGFQPSAEELIYDKRAGVADPDEGTYAATGRARASHTDDGGTIEREGAGGTEPDSGRPGEQPDAFGERPGDARTALERRAEGRQRSDVAQKPPGSDGGLFDVHDTTGELAMFDNPNSSSVVPITDSIEHDIRLAVDEGGEFSLGDGDTRTAKDILADLDEEAAAIKAVKDCL